MHAQNWSDALTLLSLLIMDEDISRDDKISRFKTAAVNFKNRVSPNFMMTPDIAYDWYIQNESDNIKSMSSIHYNRHMNRILKNLDALPDKQGFLFALMKVTLSDQGSSKTQQGPTQRFIDTVENNWKLKFSKTA